MPSKVLSTFQEVSQPSITSIRRHFKGAEGFNLNNRGLGTTSWIRICKEGTIDVLEADKLDIMRRCHLPSRDLRLLDPLVVYPSTILGRERAIVVNLEQIRCIITADEVILKKSLENSVLKYIWELQRRLASKRQTIEDPYKWPSQVAPLAGEQALKTFDNSEAVFVPEEQELFEKGTYTFNGTPSDGFPFEFNALEVALEAACIYLDRQATDIKEEAYPILDELMSKISTLSLERARRLKSRLLAMTRRVQKVRDQIEQLMNHDDDMMEMCLTNKRNLNLHLEERNLVGGNHLMNEQGSVSPVSPMIDQKFFFDLVSPTHYEEVRSLERAPNAGMRPENKLEMLLEAYFVLIDCTLNKLTSLKEYIDDTEVLIKIQLDTLRNKLIQYKVCLSIANFVVAIFQVITGIFGMNVPIDLFDEPWAFKWVIIISGIGCSLIFILLLCIFKFKCAPSL